MATLHSASLYVVGGRMLWQRAQFSAQSCEPPLVGFCSTFDSVGVAVPFEAVPDVLSSPETRLDRKRATTSAAMNKVTAGFRMYEEFVFIGKISALKAHRRLQKICGDIFVLII